MVPELARGPTSSFISEFCCSVLRARYQFAPDISRSPDVPPQAKLSGDHIPLGGFVYSRSRMTIDDQDHVDRSTQPRAAWAEVWHLWKVIVPRRSITGRLVHGRVWRRHNGRHWIYKKFVKYKDLID
jgi:hypothetical protein